MPWNMRKIIFMQQCLFSCNVALCTSEFNTDKGFSILYSISTTWLMRENATKFCQNLRHPRNKIMKTVLAAKFNLYSLEKLARDKNSEMHILSGRACAYSICKILYHESHVKNLEMWNTSLLLYFCSVRTWQ